MVLDARLYELDNRMDQLRSAMARFPGTIVRDYRERLDVSWVFHDHALEGVVLSYSELKAAIDHRIISDVSLIPMYEDVKNHKITVDYLRDALREKRAPEISVEFIKKLYLMLTPDPGLKGPPVYRKENPLHRLYYHEITAPEKIQPRMKKLDDWISSSEFKDLHPLQQAARIQLELLAIYPWTKNSGKVGRMLSNYILLQAGYLPAVIHSIERQRYYDSLRHENDTLLMLLIESLENSIETSQRFFDELRGLAVRRAS
ncbi:MAG: Fic family protein [Deltaproteobacteria bacterium]|nr:Fic family protein [Deltaproteobacteria bacterium]